MNSKNIEKNNLNVNEFVSEMSNLIYDENIWWEQEMWKVAEVTYSYVQLEENANKRTINTTLFHSLWNLQVDDLIALDEESKNIKIQAAYNIVESKLVNKSEQIKQIFPDIVDLFSKANTNEKMMLEIFQWSLEEKLLFIEYGLNGLKYEGQKAGLDIKISAQAEQNIDNRQAEIDSLLFDGAVKDKPEEVIKCYEYIYNLYLEKKDSLDNTDKVKIEKYINKIKNILPEWYRYVKPIKLEDTLKGFDNMDEISQENYMKAFNLAIEWHPWLDYSATTSDSAKSISDWPDGYIVPTTEKFKKFKGSNWARLNSHENEIHNISDHNSQQLIGKIRWAWSIIKDEGVAMLMEMFLKFWNQLFIQDTEINKWIIDIKKVPIKGTFVRSLMWELIEDDEELLDCFNALETIDTDNIESSSRVSRVRRSNKTQTQKKDTSYMRGLFKVVELINEHILSGGVSGLSFEDLMLWKVGFDDTLKLKAIKKEKEKNNEEVHLLSPLFLSDAVYYWYEEQIKWKEITWKWFYHYLQNKYPILNFSEQQILSQWYTTKKNVLAILELFKKNQWIEHNQKLINRGIKDLSWKRTN